LGGYARDKAQVAFSIAALNEAENPSTAESELRTMPSFLVIWLITGFIAGFLASHFVGGGRGVVLDIVIGLVGAVVGGLVLGTAFGNTSGGFISQVIVASFGALICLAVLRLVARPRRRLFR
jgi:uncharacterized membrane protein YeaQ/YmgE (transglycosylase-associated protein family)